MEIETKPWLIVDVSNLCHRAWHGLRDFSQGDVGLAVRFGFFRDLSMLYRRFEPVGVLLAFDSASSKRKEVYPGYKGARETARVDEDDETKEARQELYKTISSLEYLDAMASGIGHDHTIALPGYEADDLIAVMVAQVDRALIVSSDQDLYQLLRPGVEQLSLHTGRVTTYSSFKETYGIEPSKWATVKAIAGCSSDSIPGIAGVGEKTAIKYLNRELKETTQAFAKIKDPENRKMVGRNLKLTTIPFPGASMALPPPRPINGALWDSHMKTLEFPSLVGAVDLKRVWGRAHG